MRHMLKTGMLKAFEQHLIEEEKSRETVKKYLRDARAFFQAFEGGGPVTKEGVIRYKQALTERYAPSSVNSMLAAVNHFLRWQGWLECVVKAVKIQREVFRADQRELSKEEYFRLLSAARSGKKEGLCLIMETLGATGIRVGELRFITVEAAREGCAMVSLKRKTRRVLLPGKLCRKLLRYAGACGRRRGSIFVTRTGRPLDRSNILHGMKQLCRLAQVERRKVFPHNLRHLFACVFYEAHKDLSRLADLLGHSSVNTTRIYTCISGAEHARHIEQLGLVI